MIGNGITSQGNRVLSKYIIGTTPAKLMHFALLHGDKDCNNYSYQLANCGCLADTLTLCFQATLIVDGSPTAINISGAIVSLAVKSIHHKIFGAGDDALIIVLGCCVNQPFRFQTCL